MIGEQISHFIQNNKIIIISFLLLIVIIKYCFDNNESLLEYMEALKK